MLVAILLAVPIGLLIYAFASRVLSRSPPGPVGVPGVGVLPLMIWRQMTKKGHRNFLQLQEFHRRYGDVMSFTMGTQEFILISGYEALREASVLNADKFIGRGNTNYHKFRRKGAGIVGSEGALWQEHRRFALRVLKDFGFGRNASETHIQEEAAQAANYLRSKDGQVVDPRDFIEPSVANVVTRFIFSNFSSYEDPEFKEFLEKVFVINNQSLLDLLTVLYRALPVETALAISPSNRRGFDAITWVEDVSRRHVENIRSKYNVAEEPSNYVESYLQEQHRRGENVGTFTDFQLVKTIWELFIGGVHTTSTSLRWCLLYAAVHPELQDRCHDEIKASIGKRTVTMKDKKDLNFCQAFMDEVQRITTLAPTAVEHRAEKDTEFRGYHISSNAVIYMNLYSIHNDEKLFPEPSRFDPNRFLTLDGQYKHSEYLSHFGIGKRSCLGEILARMELLIFFVTYMQHFRFGLEKGMSSEKLEAIMVGTDGAVRSPLEHQLVVATRE